MGPKFCCKPGMVFYRKDTYQYDGDRCCVLHCMTSYNVLVTLIGELMEHLCSYHQ